MHAKAFEMQPSASNIDSLKAIPFLDNPQAITGLEEVRSSPQFRMLFQISTYELVKIQ